MIGVQRTAKPAVLVDNEIAWKAAIRSAITKKQRDTAQAKYQHREIKAELVAMFAGNCAYCESKIRHIDYGHIEHFRPKSWPAFYELAVEWTNLLLSCGVCNGAEHKGTNFPDAAAGGPLLDPCIDNPADHMRFEYDRKVKLAPIVPTTTRGDTTIRILGLNRHELLKYRSNCVRKLAAIAVFYQSDQEAREIIDQSVTQGSEYRAFAIPIRHSANQAAA